jgi:SAM-dependent methyltransferase
MMRPEIVAALLTLNQEFYEKVAEPFAQSRESVQPGFYRILNTLPAPCRDFLDVGCGDGRLGRFLQQQEAIGWYTGVDFSPKLLTRASSMTQGEFFQRDLSRAGCLADLGRFDAIACLAALQHIPGLETRARLLKEIASCLVPSGRLVLSTWQFAKNERLRRKVIEWGEIGLSPRDVEANDYLLTWKRGVRALRYVAYIDAAEVEYLTGQADLHIIQQFRSDGKEGDLNLYTILTTDG